jgi:hypothetical protein
MSEGQDVAVEALLEFLNAVEAGVAAAKHLISRKKGIADLPGFDELPWIEQQGTKGPYQQTSRQKCQPCNFDRLKAELKSHGGFWEHNGWKYWFHAKDENLIDRRRS